MNAVQKVNEERRLRRAIDKMNKIADALDIIRRNSGDKSSWRELRRIIDDCDKYPTSLHLMSTKIMVNAMRDGIRRAQEELADKLQELSK